MQQQQRAADIQQMMSTHSNIMDTNVLYNQTKEAIRQKRQHFTHPITGKEMYIDILAWEGVQLNKNRRLVTKGNNKPYDSVTMPYRINEDINVRPFAEFLIKSFKTKELFHTTSWHPLHIAPHTHKSMYNPRTNSIELAFCDKSYCARAIGRLVYILGRRLGIYLMKREIDFDFFRLLRLVITKIPSKLVYTVLESLYILTYYSDDFDEEMERLPIDRYEHKAVYDKRAHPENPCLDPQQVEAIIATSEKWDAPSPVSDVMQEINLGIARFIKDNLALIKRKKSPCACTTENKRMKKQLGEMKEQLEEMTRRAENAERKYSELKKKHKKKTGFDP